MKSHYKPLYETIFPQFGYSWEDLDKLIYPKILKEEGYTKNEIQTEMNFLDKKDWSTRCSW